MFGIFLPLNFNSPYKAQNIIDFWRRWHMTLSQFLRGLSLYPARRQPARPGAALRQPDDHDAARRTLARRGPGPSWRGARCMARISCINHAWNKYGPAVASRFARAATMAAFVLTFLSVVVAWVFFRADSLPSAISVLSKMADPTTIVFGRSEMADAVFIAIYAAIAWRAPNTQEIMGYDHRNRDGRRGARRVADAPDVPLCKCCGAGLRDTRNPAAQRIHLFQILEHDPEKWVPVFREDHAQRRR